MTRRRPAAASRVLLAGVSAAATLGMVATIARAAPELVLPDDTPLRVVVTDPRIDPDAAVAAARAAARAGRSSARVPVAAAAQPASFGGSHVPHTRTRSS